MLSNFSYAEEVDLAKLKKDIQSQMPDDPITSLINDNGIYKIKYTFVGFVNPIIDYGILEDFAYRIMDVFLDNNIIDLREIRIEATTTTPLKKGIISKITITKQQLIAYGKEPIKWATYNKFKQFTFDEQFFLPKHIEEFHRWYSRLDVDDRKLTTK